MIRFTVVTVFPDLFASFLAESFIKRAIDSGLVTVDLVNPRDFTTDRHRTVDDAPFGGGEGMVMTCDPLVQAIETIKGPRTDIRTVVMSPGGTPFSQAKAEELAVGGDVILVAGRYEGIDQRVMDHFADEELSIGDYVLNGGEIPAMVVIEATTRLIPGVVGNTASITNDTFSQGLLKHPQYTRPREYRGHAVPDILLSGDHAKIEAWRQQESLRRTRESRPDLLVDERDQRDEHITN